MRLQPTAWAILGSALALPLVAHARRDTNIDRGIDPTAGLPHPGLISGMHGDAAIRANIDRVRLTATPGRQTISPRTIPTTTPVRVERGAIGTMSGESGIPNRTFGA